MQIRVDSWCAGCQCKTAALLSILSQQLPHCNNTPAPEPMGPAAGDRAAYPCPQLIYGTRVISLQKNFFFLIQINKSKVLPPSFPRPAPKRGGWVGAALVKEVSRPAGGRMREGKKGTSAHYFAWLWNSLSRHCKVLIQQSQPETMACEGKEGGRKRKKESVLIIRSPPSWKEWSWGQGNGKQSATGSSTH